MDYTATIKHHTISSAPVIPVGDDLAKAKRAAIREFGTGFNDHTIVIMGEPTPANPSGFVSAKRIGSGKWINEVRANNKSRAARPA